MPTVAELLEASKALIMEYGWVKGSDGSEKRGFCARGAITRVMYAPEVQKMPAWNETFGEVRRTLERGMWQVDDDFCCIPDWNDHPDRTRQEVMAAFDAAITLVRN